MIVCGVPMAFFVPEHLEMSREFLGNLVPEVDKVRVWHNGGPLEAEGQALLEEFPVEIVDARGWMFYKMWNQAALWAQDLEADVLILLNNDVTWPQGAVRALGDALAEADVDIAVASPDPASEFHPDTLQDIFAAPAFRGLLGWAFAIRPTMWQMIDERYHSWYGDDELALQIHDAGWRACRARGIPIWHNDQETTFKHVPEIWRLRTEDEQLYREKWGDHFPQVAVNLGVTVELD